MKHKFTFDIDFHNGAGFSAKNGGGMSGETIGLIGALASVLSLTVSLVTLRKVVQVKASIAGNEAKVTNIGKDNKAAGRDLHVK